LRAAQIKAMFVPSFGSSNVPDIKGDICDNNVLKPLRLMKN
jgi:hypothetical protein